MREMHADTLHALLEMATGDESALESLRLLVEDDPTPVALCVSCQGGSGLEHVYANGAYRALAPHVEMEGRTYDEVWPDGMQRLEIMGDPYVLVVVPPPIVADKVETGPGSSQPAEKPPASDIEERRSVLRAFMENTDAQLAYLDTDMKFVEVNSAYVHGSNHTEAELLGRNHFDLFPDTENQAIFERVRDTGEGVEFRAKPFEYANQPWRGVTYWDWRLTPVKDQDGTVLGLVLSLVDVTASVSAKLLSDAINRVNGIVHSTLDARSIIEQVVPELAAGIHCECIAVALLSGSSDLRIVDVFGLPEEMRGSTMPMTEFPGALQALEADRPLVIGKPEIARFNGRHACGTELCSLMVAPLALASQRYGIIAFGYRSGPGAFDEPQVDFAGKVAASLSLALNNARLFELCSREARYAEALNRIDTAAHSILDTEEMMVHVVAEVAETMEVGASAVSMRRGGYWKVTYAHGLPEELCGVRMSDSDAPLPARAFEARETIVSVDALNDPRANQCLMKTYDIASLIAAPLVVRGEVIGTLIACCFGETKTFADEQVDFMNRAAATLALALENVRLYEREREIADRLQQALQSMPDELPGAEFSHAYHSATEAARVGGDFYDIFELDQHHLGVTIGDVAGKGIDAAALTSLAKNTIRAHAAERGKTPREIISLTNELIVKATPTESFLTAFFGILDCRDGRLVYANAGHATGTVLKVDGRVSRLPVTGPMLGAFAGVGFEQAEVRLEPGDLLFLYTDGLTETRSGLEFYGEARLMESLGTSSYLTPSEVVERVVYDVLAFGDGELPDDLAILAVRLAEEQPEVPRQQKLPLALNDDVAAP